MKMGWRRGGKGGYEDEVEKGSEGGANRRGKQMKQNRRRLDLENIEGGITSGER